MTLEQWLDRDFVDNNIEGVEAADISWDANTDVHRFNGTRFTGVLKGRTKDGRLNRVAQFRNGYAEGVSVVWYPDGTPFSYAESVAGSLSGLSITWERDGTVRLRESYLDGKRVS
jgi:antitoxin component YwqK of YwqJK toxin-antitoxin module